MRPPAPVLRQPSQEQPEDESFSILYCTMFLFLLGCFVLGIIMAVLGVLRWAVIGGQMVT